jgi:hypothetical protein
MNTLTIDPEGLVAAGVNAPGEFCHFGGVAGQVNGRG